VPKVYVTYGAFIQTVSYLANIAKAKTTYLHNILQL